MGHRAAASQRPGPGPSTCHPASPAPATARHPEFSAYRGTSHMRNSTPLDPTVALCLGTYGDPMGAGVYYERGRMGHPAAGSQHPGPGPSTCHPALPAPATARHHLRKNCGGSEAGSYLRLIDSCITRLKAQGPSSMTCNESKEAKGIQRPKRAGHPALPAPATAHHPRNWCLTAEQPAPAPHLAHPEGCAALLIILVTGPRVSHPRPTEIQRPAGAYRGTSLIRNNPPVGPYSSPVPRDLW